MSRPLQFSDVRARELVRRLTVPDPIGAEVGVWRGQMSAQLLTMHPGMFLFMVDRWDSTNGQPRDPRKATQDELCQEAQDVTAFAERRREVVRMDSLAAADTIEDGSLDFVFIDADHSYESVRADIRAWLPKLKAGALLSGHDYSPPGKYSRHGWPGVVRAVDEVVERNGWTLDLGENATWFVRLP